jgi:hypothetical protein
LDSFLAICSDFVEFNNRGEATVKFVLYCVPDHHGRNLWVEVRFGEVVGFFELRNPPKADNSDEELPDAPNPDQVTFEWAVFPSKLETACKETKFIGETFTFSHA